MANDEEARSPSPAPAASGSEAPSGKAIDLKILSPSVDVPASGLFFENLPVTTTLGQLRNRITDALSSRPPPARQRLIYFGRVLQRDDDTLAGVFGDQNIQNQRQHTLHLVLPLREGGSQTPNAPSPIPGPRASIYPPSAIPRPSSVPPRGNGAASPFRTFTPQGNTSQPPAPTSATIANTQPQSQTNGPRPSASGERISLQFAQQEAQTPNTAQQASIQIGGQQFGIQSLITNGSLRASLTNSSGQAVNLPPEALNQLLNQHIRQHGGLPDLLQQAAAQRAQSQDPNQQVQPHGTPQPAPIPPPRVSTPGDQLFQQFMESVNQRQAQAGAGGGTSDQGSSPQDGQEERGRPRSSHHDAQNEPAAPPTTSNGETFQQPPASAPSQPRSHSGPHTNGHVSTTVLPDGSRVIRHTVTTTHNHAHPHPHPQHHHHGQPPQIPAGMQGLQFHMPFPQGFPFPQPQAFGQPGMPIPLAAPVAGLRPQGQAGTPRSISPARSVSEGPIRRVGTPAAELQHRLMHTNAEIQNLNTLLGVLANGTMANGQPAPPITQEQMSQIRQFADSMNTHIEGFGGDLERLANAHPGVRMQPEFAGLSAMFQTVQGQGRGIAQRIEGLADQGNVQNGNVGGVHVSVAEARDVPAAVAAAAQEASSHPASLTPGVPPPPRESLTPPSLATPSTTSDTLSPSLITRETSPADHPATMPNIPAIIPPPTTPQLYLLSDPTNTQHYLLNGPHGMTGVGALPLDVLYPLLAAQLPHDQLIRDFNRATNEMVRALQRADFRTALNAGLALPLGGPAAGVRNASNASTATVTAAQGQQPAPAGAVNIANAAAGPANAAVPAVAPNAAGVAMANRPNANAPPDEMRDVLAPIVRNLWLIVRLCVFGWFFLSSGRGYGRLLILCVLGGIVWAVQHGLLGRRMERVLDAVRQHFAEVAEEARGQRPIVDGQAQPPVQAGDNAGEGSSRQAGRDPTPEEVARRLMVQRANRQRAGIWAALRQAERTIALCVASLWPGVGEAVVRNAERARREAERRGEEERKKKEEEEEEAAKKAAADADAEKLKVTIEDVGEGGSSGAEVADANGMSQVNRGKGKERAAETSPSDVD